jgi:hypothetical protein
MRRVVGPVRANWFADGFVKQLVLPGKHGVAAPAPAEAVNTAGPPWNGGPAGSANTVTGIVFWLPSQGNRSVGTKLKLDPDPRAIERPDACSTVTLTLSETIVSDGLNGEQETVTGSVIATRPERLGAPRLIVIACAVAAVAPHAATSAARGRAFRNI